MKEIMQHNKEYRKSLPHIHPENAVFFITYRVAGTIPKHILDNYILEKEKHESFVDYFNIVDDYLDKQDGNLTKPELAEVIAESLLFYNNKYYSLISFCIMSNHVHFIINTNNYPYKNLFLILKSIKGFSANRINRILNRNGRFWQQESYDHVIKSRNELANTISYTINNPVKAGLVRKWTDWKFTYLDRKYIDE